MRLQSLRTRTLLVAPIRLVLGAAWLVGARLAGAAPGPAFAAFGIGAAVVAFVALNDPRARVLRRDPRPLPEGEEVHVDPRWRHAAAAVFPSTVGLSVLAAVTVAPQPVLTALLAGATAGLGIAAALSLPGLDDALLVDPRRSIVYRR
ncbi:MAG TPA: hypothetical protein VFA56_04070 [Gaiellaceae bacterium]|nr:hypothetical protein [Gaiellaceae bacterium]